MRLSSPLSGHSGKGQSGFAKLGDPAFDDLRSEPRFQNLVQRDRPASVDLARDEGIRRSPRQVIREPSRDKVIKSGHRRIGEFGWSESDLKFSNAWKNWVEGLV